MSSFISLPLDCARIKVGPQKKATFGHYKVDAGRRSADLAWLCFVCKHFSFAPLFAPKLVCINFPRWLMTIERERRQKKRPLFICLFIHAPRVYYCSRRRASVGIKIESCLMEWTQRRRRRPACGPRRAPPPLTIALASAVISHIVGICTFFARSLV
jgi:hypothetical protein